MRCYASSLFNLNSPTMCIYITISEKRWLDLFWFKHRLKKERRPRARTTYFKFKSRVDSQLLSPSSMSTNWMKLQQHRVIVNTLDWDECWLRFSLLSLFSTDKYVFFSLKHPSHQKKRTKRFLVTKTNKNKNYVSCPPLAFFFSFFLFFHCKVFNLRNIFHSKPIVPSQ